MAKKYKNTGINWVDTLSIKQLKFEAVQRGLDFIQVSSLSVPQLQGWVEKHRDSIIDKARLVRYDKFVRGIDDLDFNNLGFHMDSEDKPLEKLTKEYREHKIGYVPRAGTKKELTQALVRKGLPTKDIILEVFKVFGRTNPQSIKSWASRFRKQLKVEAMERGANGY